MSNYNNNQNRNNNNNQSNQNNNGNEPKTTWAVYTKLKDSDLYIVNAFRKTKQGLIKYTVKPYGNSYDKDGNAVIVEGDKFTYFKMICVIDYPMGAPETLSVLFNRENHKITLQSKGLVITPNGNGTLASGKRVKGAVVKYY